MSQWVEAKEALVEAGHQDEAPLRGWAIQCRGGIDHDCLPCPGPTPLPQVVAGVLTEQEGGTRAGGLSAALEVLR